MSDAAAIDAPKVSGKSKMLIIVLCSLLAAGAAGGAVYFMTAAKGDEKHAETEAAPGAKTPAIYSKFDPPFVVNFQNKGQMRFLQVSIEVMTRDVATADLIKQHDPKLRNDLLMLLGGQAFTTRRYVFWNFVSSSRDRINQAKEDWKALRFPLIPGDDQEYIPLPEVPTTVSYP